MERRDASVFFCRLFNRCWSLIYVLERVSYLELSSLTAECIFRTFKNAFFAGIRSVTPGQVLEFKIGNFQLFRTSKKIGKNLTGQGQGLLYRLLPPKKAHFLSSFRFPIFRIWTSCQGFFEEKENRERKKGRKETRVFYFRSWFPLSSPNFRPRKKRKKEKKILF